MSELKLRPPKEKSKERKPRKPASLPRTSSGQAESAATQANPKRARQAPPLQDYYPLPRTGCGPAGRRRYRKKLGGLYTGFCRGKQELQKGADARRPGSFVVLGAFYALKMKVTSELPALTEKHIAEALDVFQGVPALARARVQPDARHGPGGRRGGEPED